MYEQKSLVMVYLVSGGTTEVHGSICPQNIFFLPQFSPKIMTNVLKLDQIWWFQHKTGKNIYFWHALHTFFTVYLFKFPIAPVLPLYLGRIGCFKRGMVNLINWKM